MTQTAPLLEVRGVTKRFGGLVANADVDLDVHAGEIVAVIGPNGAGKTTLFSLISGFYRPDAGSIRFDGREISRLQPDRIAQLGLARTFQIVRTFKEMTVLENVLVGALLRTQDVRAARAEAEQELAFTGLAPRAQVRGGALTIADKKRVEVARALATRPKLLLLDEVMAGLNPRETTDAVDLVRRIAARGITVLLIEHVMEVVMPLAVRATVLDYGRKIAEGPPREIAQDPDVIKAYLGERYVERRLAARPS